MHSLFTGLVMSSIGNGSGITTSLISLIANAGQVDQAIATAGTPSTVSRLVLRQCN